MAWLPFRGYEVGIISPKRYLKTRLWLFSISRSKYLFSCFARHPLKFISKHLLLFLVCSLLTYAGKAQSPSLEWVRTFPSVGAPNIIIPNGVTTDAANNVYTTGVLYNTRDFDPGLGTFNLTSAGNSDIFVSKLNASGGLIWAVRVGGTGADEGTSIAVDLAGDIYVTGDYVGTVDFDPGPGVTNLTGGGSYIVKLTSAGAFVWAKRIGSGTGNDIVADEFGDIIAIGSFTGTSDFDPGTPVLNLTSSGSTDIFVSKLTPATGDLIWVAQMGGASFDQGYSLITDASGNVYTTGTFQGSADFDPGAGTQSLTSAGSNDVFITKLSSTRAFVWTKRIGSTLSEQADAITLDQAGNVVSTGSFSGTVDFDPNAGTATLTASGSTDAYVSKLNSSGNYLWAKNVGSTSITRGHSVVTDASGSVYYTGEFSGVVDFDPGAGVFNVTPTLDPGAYVSKLDANGNFQWVVAPRGPGTGFEGVGMSITLDGAENILAAGWFNNSVDFDPGPCDESLIATSDDIYIWKLNPFVLPSTVCAPVVTSFTPASGPTGTTVTITGTRFSATASNNVVFFGATRATVTGGTSTQLTVTVPVGATFEPLSVTTTNGTSYSAQPFLVTFPNGGLVNTCSFEPVAGIGTGAQGYGLAVGDIDGDGKVDIAVPDYANGLVHVYRNISSAGVLSSGSFAAAVDFPAGTNPYFTEIADIDGDGKLDLIATGYASNILSVFRNTSTLGSISFAAPAVLATNVGPYQIATGDLDGDGRTDIAISNANSGGVSIWQNIGSPGSITSGSFSAKFDIAMPSQWVIAIKDLDLDGKPDLISGPALSTTLTVFQNISTVGVLNAGSFAAGVNFTVGTWPEFITVGDLDNDSRPDIVTSSGPDTKISILKNTSAPGTINASSFAPKVEFATGSEPRGVEITDFDGDGLADIALANQINNQVWIYKNQSTPGTINAGSFAAPVGFTAGGNLRSVKGADFDGDGKPDLAVGNWSNPSLTVLRNDILGTTSVTGFSPSTGPVGSTVTITGTNFSTQLTDNVVSFNGKQAFVTAATPTQLTVIVPGGATTGPISVTVTCGTPVSSSTFTVTPLVYNTCSTITLSGGGNYIEVTRNPSIEPASVTIEALVNFTSLPLFGVIAAKQDGTAVGDSYAIWYEAGLLRAGVRLGGGVALAWTPVFNQWYHIALTYNSTTQVQRLYLNGEIVASGSSLPPVYSADHLLFGADINFGVHDGFFPGKLDEIRFWNIERTPLEIVTNLTANLTGNEPGLVLYHKINETGQGAGITVVNSATATGAVNNGVTVGNATTPVFQGSCSCVPATERDALIALYNATDGANWNDNTGWLSADVSTWYGVTVSGCNVTDINLSGNNLIGGIPPEIGNLTLLEGLDLGANQLNGWIPPEIGNLSALTALNLSINQLVGSVPMELSYLSNLQVLGLAFNQLGGNLPVDLMFLNNLTDVFLNNNQFTGDLPLIGGTTANMNTLLAQFNKFSDLPDLNSYASTGIINVSSNQLTFDDLEPYMGLAGLSYDPQAKVPPGGFVAFIPGNDLIINFSTGGTANSYQWYKNNVLIPGATSTNLLITNATPADVGLYEVRITNSIVPLLTLSSMTYTVITDPCGASTPTSGDLDTGFAPLISAPSTFLGVGVQSTGKIITSTSYTIENSTIKSGVLRFNTDGSLDNSFAVNPYAGEVLVQPDNKVLVAYSDGTYAYPVRLNSDGTDDTGFNGNVPQYYSGSISAMAYQTSNNTILVAGGAYMTPLFVERLNLDGTSAGTLPDATDLYVTTIAVQSDDYILVGGEFVGGIRRLDPSGVLDPTFIGEASDFVTDIVVQPDGKILVAGLFQFFNDLPHPGIVRLNPDGTIDNTFTALGITDLIDLGYYPTKLLLQSDNKILVAGLFETINGASRRNLVRLNPDGTVDCSFDPGVSSDSVIEGLAIQSNGQILISGSFTSYESTPRYGLARINGVSASLTITLQPSDVLICDGGMATFSTAATGTTNITYQWQFSPDGIVPFADIANGGAYSGANTSTLSVNTTGMFGAGRYQCRINGDGATQVITNDEGLFVYAFPTAPPGVGGSACGAASVTLTSSGIPNGNYRWYSVATGGTPIIGAVNDTFVTPVLGSTTTFYVAANNGVCESLTRTPVVATINTIPGAPTTIGGSACGPNPVLLTASGSVNGNYRWYTVATGGTAITGETNSTYATPVLLSTTTYYAAINDGTCESSTRTAAIATINSLPAAPTTTGATSCPSTSMTLSASGGVNGQYRWYTVATGGTAIVGEVNDTYVTPVLTTSTTYHVAINDGICESVRTPVIATINTVGKPTVVTSNCTATGAILTGPSGFATYAWSNGASTPSINISVAGTYTLIVTNSTGCVSPPSDPTVFTAAFCNQPPVITTTSITTPVQSTVTLSVSSLTSDLDNNIDFSTLAVVVGPVSGANAFFNANNELVVDYTDVAFAGTDQLTIRVCDLAAACAQEVITIEVAGDITVFNAVSPNGDGKNDELFIEYINALPDTKNNKLTIFNRWGSVVFEATNYDNSTVVFRGIGSNGNELPPGTYFYTLEFTGGKEKRTGFISLRR